MSRVGTGLRMSLGGAVCGAFLGIFAGGLFAALAGALLGDVSAGLDGALFGGAAGCLGGALFGVFLALRDDPDGAPPQEPDSRPEAPGGRGEAVTTTHAAGR